MRSASHRTGDGGRHDELRRSPTSPRFPCRPTARPACRLGSNGRRRGRVERARRRQAGVADPRGHRRRSRCTPRPTSDGLDFLDTFPGVVPYLRGPYPTMYVNQPWTVRQYAGFSTAEDSNAFYRRNLAAGQKGLSVAFDLPTHRGYDSDNPRVAGDVGMAGVAIDSIYDMRVLFDGIPLDQMSVSMTMNGAVLPVLSLYIVAAEEQGVKPRPAGRDHPERHPQGVHGPEHLHLPADPVDADRLRHLRLHVDPHAAVQLDLDLRLPHAGGRGDGRPRAGLHAGRRLEYVPAGIEAGLEVDKFAPRLSFFWAIGMNFFMEVAKLRAARLLWAKLVQERFAPSNTKSLSLRTHSQTSGWSLTAQDVYNNVVRTCIEAMAVDPGPHAEPAHQRARRGAGAADRLLGPHRPQHPAVPPAGVRTRPTSSTRGVAATTSNASPTSVRKGARTHRARSRSSAGWPRPSRPASRSCASRRPRPAPRPASTRDASRSSA